MTTIKPLRLSEAIRFGAMLRPQSFGGMFAKGGSCAIGAAAEAIEISPEQDEGFWQWRKLTVAFPFITALASLPCPECDTKAEPKKDGYSLITHLNDHHKFSRERIADYVELHYEPEAMLPERCEAELPEIAEVTCQSSK